MSKKNSLPPTSSVLLNLSVSLSHCLQPLLHRVLPSNIHILHFPSSVFCLYPSHFFQHFFFLFFTIDCVNAFKNMLSTNSPLLCTSFSTISFSKSLTSTLTLFLFFFFSSIHLSVFRSLDPHDLSSLSFCLAPPLHSAFLMMHLAFSSLSVLALSVSLARCPLPGYHACLMWVCVC